MHNVGKDFPIGAKLKFRNGKKHIDTRHFNKNDFEDIEDKLERLTRVTKCLTAKASRLASDFKNRKFRYTPETLEEKEISCSQYSILQSQPGDSENYSVSNLMILNIVQ